MMKAVVYNGKCNIAVEEILRPEIIHPRDAIIRVMSASIGGADLNIYNGDISSVKPGDILGHECMGFIEELGPQVKHLRKGDRVVVSAVYACGQCEFCKKREFSMCNETNFNKEQEASLGGHRIAGLMGLTASGGGYPGGQAQFIRVPYADVNCLIVGPELPDEKVLFLSDILCTAWYAVEMGAVCKGQVVAVWGCGPVGILVQWLCKLRGASRVIAIDNEPYRLELAKKNGAEIINFEKLGSTPVHKRLLELVPHGPDVSIDAVGVRFAKSLKHRVQRSIGLETVASDVPSEAIYATRKGGYVVLIGEYEGETNNFPIGPLMEKGLILRGGITPMQKYWDELLAKLKYEEIDTSQLVSHVLPLSEAPRAYKIFDQHEENAMKIILKPWM